MIKGVLNKIGVFSATLLATVFAVFMYSPTNGSFAAGDASDVTVNIGTILSFGISSDSVSMSGTPGETVITDPIRAYGYTNNRRGLTVCVNDADDDNNLNNIDASIDDKIRPFRNDILEALMSGQMSDTDLDFSSFEIENMGDNEWGYVADYMKTLYDSTKTYVLPLNVDGGEELVFSLDNPTSQYSEGLHVDIYDGGNGERGVVEYGYVDDNGTAYGDVQFAIKLGRRLTSGTYTDTVEFTAFAEDY